MLVPSHILTKSRCYLEYTITKLFLITKRNASKRLVNGLLGLGRRNSRLPILCNLIVRSE